MRGLFDFVIKPSGDRYNNSISVGEGSLILNTEISNHNFVNKIGEVLTTPLMNNTLIKPGDTVAVHHNVFRRWYNVRGDEKNSRSFLKEDQYLVSTDQIFLYKRDDTWNAMPGFTFIKPIKSIDGFNVESERPLIGVVKHNDGTFNNGELVGFSPGDEFEFVIDGERLYRVMNRFITIKYEYQGDEEEYNPSWAQSS